MNLAMDCASYASPARLDAIRRDAPRSILGDAINMPLPDVCDTPGLPRLEDTFRAPITSDVPALLIAGTFDGRTPVTNAQAVAAGLAKSEVMVVPNVSHDLFRSAAVLERMVEFLKAR
jgi:pimeloyl-ACP methyl ester carboxylesterase